MTESGYREVSYVPTCMGAIRAWLGVYFGAPPGTVATCHVGYDAQTHQQFAILEIEVEAVTPFPLLVALDLPMTREVAAALEHFHTMPGAEALSERLRWAERDMMRNLNS